MDMKISTFESSLTASEQLSKEHEMLDTSFSARSFKTNKGFARSHVPRQPRADDSLDIYVDVKVLIVRASKSFALNYMALLLFASNYWK